MLSFLFPRWCKPEKRSVGQMRWLEVVPGLDAPLIGIDAAARLAKQASHLGLPFKQRIRHGQLFFRFVIQCKGPSGKIRLFFAVPEIRLMGFTTVFQTQYPGMYLLPATDHELLGLKVHAYTHAAVGYPTRKGLLSIVPFHLDGKDALNEILMAMGAGELDAHEEAWLDITFAPSTKRELQKRITKAEKWVQSPANEAVSLQSIWREMKTDAKARSKHRDLSEHQQKLLGLLQTKRSKKEIGLWTCFRVYLDLPSSKARLQTMNVTLQSMTDENGLFFRSMKADKMKKLLKAGVPSSLRLLFTSDELAHWLRIPSVGQPAAAHLKNRASKIIAAPDGLNHGIYIGKSNVPSVEKEIRMPLGQMLKHSFLAGTTGSGKTSTLLSVMIRMMEDLQKSPGKAPGFTFLDPHGGAIETLLSYIPKSLYSKLHIIPLGNTNRPRGFNLFQAEHAQEAEALTGEFVATLQQLFPGSRPRAEHYLRNGVLSLLSVPPQTVLGIVHIFLNESYRRKILPHLDLHLRHFWEDEFSQIKNIGEHLGPILNKLGALTTYPTSRRMLGQLKSSVNTRQAMDEGHIVLIDGSGCVPDLLKILSSLFFIDYHFTCRKRPQHQSRAHFFFADEIHLFATDILCKILAEDRKFGLSLFLATQYLSQLSDRILEAILGNVGTLMLLQLGGPDSDKLSRWLKPQVTSLDLMNLSELNAIVRTKGDQGKLELFTLKNSIVPILNKDWIQEAWAHSDEQDGRSIEAIEKEMGFEESPRSPLNAWNRNKQ